MADSIEEPDGPSRQLEFDRFVVDETPYACWEWDLGKRNSEFLAGIDPSYYRYVADANAPHLDDADHGHRAALAIRVAYSQGLETLFALLGAMIQAPECVIGWLLAYKNFELEDLVRKVTTREKVLTRLYTEPSWENLSRLVHNIIEADEGRKKIIVEGFGRAWTRFAHDYLNDKISSEYNSIKHGLRARPGGFSLSFAPERAPGQAAPPEDMKSLGGSQFGTSFYIVENLGKGRRNFRARQHSRNWVPGNLINGLYLLSFSIANVVAKLRLLNGDKLEGFKVNCPDSPEDFDTPWKFSTGVTDCSIDTELPTDIIAPQSKADILGSYELDPEESQPESPGS